jgi:hypothetical protein
MKGQIILTKLYLKFMTLEAISYLRFEDPELNVYVNCLS